MKTAAEIASEKTPSEIEEMIRYWLAQPQTDQIAAKALETLCDAAEIIESRTR